MLSDSMINTICTTFLALAVSAGCQEKFVIPDPVVNPHKDVTMEDVNSEDVIVNDTASLSAALKEAKPGDVILWKDGEYQDIVIQLKGNGREDAPITLRAQTPGGVVLKGASQIKLTGTWLAAEDFSFKKLNSDTKVSHITFSKESSHCRVSGCSIDGTGSGYNTTDSKWVSIYGTQNEVSHCSFIDKRNMGCLLVVWMEEGVVPAHAIKDNYFSRPYTHYDDKGKARNGQEAIRIGTSTYSMSDGGCTVTGNFFQNVNGELAEIISNKSCANLYEGNVFEGGEGTLTLRHGNRCTVRGNYFRSGGKSNVGGVRIIGEDHVVEKNVFLNLTGTGYKSALCLVTGEMYAELNGYWTVKNAVVRDNVFVDCTAGITVNYGARDTQDSAPENSSFVRNTIVNSAKKYVAVTVIDTPDSYMHWEDNIIYGGKQTGISLPTVSEKPQVKDYSPEIEAIISNSGIKW